MVKLFALKTAMYLNSTLLLHIYKDQIVSKTILEMLPLPPPFADISSLCLDVQQFYSQ